MDSVAYYCSQFIYLSLIWIVSLPRDLAVLMGLLHYNAEMVFCILYLFLCSTYYQNNSFDFTIGYLYHCNVSFVMIHIAMIKVISPTCSINQFAAFLRITVLPSSPFVSCSSESPEIISCSHSIMVGSQREKPLLSLYYPQLLRETRPVSYCELNPHKSISWHQFWPIQPLNVRLLYDINTNDQIFPANKHWDHQSQHCY